MSFQPKEVVRKSSLATSEKKRKTSVVSFQEKNTTIEFSHDTGNVGKDLVKTNLLCSQISSPRLLNRKVMRFIYHCLHHRPSTALKCTAMQCDD